MNLARVIGFLDVLRASLQWTRVSDMELFLRALICLDAPARQEIYWAGRLVFCQQALDIPIYDACFARYFAGDADVKQATGEPAVLHEKNSDQTSAVAMPEHPTPLGEARLIARAADLERLHQADFASLDDEQRNQVYALIAALKARPPVRRSRRRTGARKGALHVGRTARCALRWLGEVGVLRYGKPRYRRRRCVLLLDISGSMRDYAEALGMYGYSLAAALPGTAEIFAIGTRLTRLTEGLKGVSPTQARCNAAQAIRDWQGGTRLGLGLRQFLDEWGRRGLARGAVVVIASDGWESGETQMLAEQMARLRRLSYRLIWLNPHKSSPGYEPLAAGMKAALPYLDAFVGGASLQELQRLNELIHELCSSRTVVAGGRC